MKYMFTCLGIKNGIFKCHGNTFGNQRVGYQLQNVLTNFWTNFS